MRPGSFDFMFWNAHRQHLPSTPACARVEEAMDEVREF